MSVLYIKGGAVAMEFGLPCVESITVEGGRIVAIGGSEPAGAEVVDASGKLVLPGLIDVHTHGRLIALEPRGLPKLLAQDLADAARAGVTRILPTLASAPVEVWLAAMPALRELLQTPPPGAVPIGVHYEGIFINAEAGGAHPGQLIQPYQHDDQKHRALFDDFDDLVKMVTFAPEVPGNEKLIDACKDIGALMSLGHSTATPDQVKSFADQGVTHMTHLWNGMKAVHHRDPGPVVGALTDDRISVDLICDGHHLHPDIVNLIHKNKPADKRVLITDGVVIQLPGAVAGGPDQPNRLPDGRLAGSRIRLCRAIKNYIDFTGCPIHEAINMASLIPATLLGIDADHGSIAAGKVADLAIASMDFEVEATYVAGEKVGEA